MPVKVDVLFDFDFIECFTTTFLRAHSWLNWVDEDDDEDEVGLKEKPEDTTQQTHDMISTLKLGGYRDVTSYNMISTSFQRRFTYVGSTWK